MQSKLACLHVERVVMCQVRDEILYDTPVLIKEQHKRRHHKH